MYMLNKIQDLLCYRRVKLSPDEVSLIMELNLGGRIVERNGLYELKYVALINDETKNALVQDSAFLLKYYNSSIEVQRFLLWLFEAKSFYLRELYTKGFTNFYNMLLKC